MSEPVPVIAALEYASSRGTRRGRDVVIFVPSRRSVVLVLLAAAVAFWVGRRHVAWREVAHVDVGRALPGPTPVSFTPQGRLLFCGGGMAMVCDPETGRPVFTFAEPTTPRGARGVSFTLSGGREIAQLDGKVMRVYDADSGAAVKAVRVPQGVSDLLYREATGVALVAVSPGDRRFVTHTPLSGGNIVWDLDAPQSPDQAIGPVGTLRNAHMVVFSPDGRFIAMHPPLQVFDSRTLRLVMAGSGSSSYYVPGFSSDSQRVFTFSPDSGTGINAGVLLYSLSQNDPVYSGPSVSGPIEKLTISPDGRLLAVLETVLPAGTPALHLIELPSGKEIARRGCPMDWRFHNLRFFPDNSRLLVHSGAFGDLTLLEVPSLGMLANVPGRLFPSAIAPSGRYITVLDYSTIYTSRRVRVYRQVGGECRESTLGVLGMPHVWLLLVLVAGAALSLRADAARRASEPPGRWVSLVALVLLVGALPRAGQFLLTLCVEGRVLWSATPLVLICAIGLASGSRTWRMITMLVLGVCVAVNVFCLVQLRRAGLGESLVLGVVDRSYTIANLAMFVVLCGLTVGMMGVVVWLARLRLTSSV
jgi:WD40 repeat protein